MASGLLLGCPRWCSASKDTMHLERDEFHSTMPRKVGRDLFIELQGADDLSETVHVLRGDEPLLVVTTAEARSLAAALLVLAEVGESGG